MTNWILSLIFLFSVFGTAHAREYHLVDANKLDLEVMQLNANNRDPYAPEYTGRWQDKAALHWDIGLLWNTVFWDNNVHTETIDTGQVKTVGWEFYAGVHLGKYLDVYHYHHSRHIMDEPAQQDYNYPADTSSKFPVEDAYGIRIHFLPQDK